MFKYDWSFAVMLAVLIGFAIAGGLLFGYCVTRVFYG